MEKRVLLRRLEYLLDKLRSDIEYDINKVIESGCVDIEQADNDYKLPEAVFHAVSGTNKNAAWHTLTALQEYSHLIDCLTKADNQLTD